MWVLSITWFLNKFSVCNLLVAAFGTKKIIVLLNTIINFKFGRKENKSWILGLHLWDQNIFSVSFYRPNLYFILSRQVCRVMWSSFSICCIILCTCSEIVCNEIQYYLHLVATLGNLKLLTINFFLIKWFSSLLCCATVWLNYVRILRTFFRKVNDFLSGIFSRSFSATLSYQINKKVFVSAVFNTIGFPVALKIDDSSTNSLFNAQKIMFA